MKEKLSKYGFVRVGAVSPELRVGDPEFNTLKIMDAISEAVNNECYLLVFPELCITGYTCGDLFYQKILIDKAWDCLLKIAEHTRLTDTTVILGLPYLRDSRLYNCAAVINSGYIQALIPKTFLCNTNEYYEERWFSNEMDKLSDVVEINDDIAFVGTNQIFLINHVPGAAFGVEICEDLWALKPPSFDLASAGATIIFNLSASSDYLGKSKYREQLVLSQSARCISAYVYSSAGPCESSTDLVFPGHCIIAENGLMLANSNKFNFKTQISYADIDIEKIISERIKNNTFSASKPEHEIGKINLNIPDVLTDKIFRKIVPNPFVPNDKNQRADNCREIFALQTTGLAKRLLHTNLKDVTIGVSGGLDSTLALLVTVKAFKKLGYDISGINAISMPGFGTSTRTKKNSEKLTELLGVTFTEINIKKSVSQHFLDIGHDPNLHDTVFENAQARERTQILMDLANKINGIVIGTGDLSELALGWSTYNGDHISMYSVNSGVPKTLVKYLIEWCSEEEFSGPVSEVLMNIINTPISPELLPLDSSGNISQKTEELIGPYELHDFFLYYFIRFGFNPLKILFLAEIAFNKKYDNETIRKWLIIFIKRFFQNQFKRSCVPDGIKVGSVALSPRGDWRMPSDAQVDLWINDLEDF